MSSRPARAGGLISETATLALANSLRRLPVAGDVVLEVEAFSAQACLALLALLLTQVTEKTPSAYCLYAINSALMLSSGASPRCTSCPLKSTAVAQSPGEPGAVRRWLQEVRDTKHDNKHWVRLGAARNLLLRPEWHQCPLLSR